MRVQTGKKSLLLAENRCTLNCDDMKDSEDKEGFDEMKKSVGERIRSARRMRGLTQDELSQRLSPKISKDALAKFERGDNFPGSSTLLALKKALGVTLDYLFRPTADAISEVRYLKKSSISARELDMVTETVKDKIERYNDIEDSLGVGVGFDSSSGYAVSNLDDVCAAALSLRRDWGIGEESAVSVIDNLEANGIRVVEVSAPADFRGMCGYANTNRPFIVLNESLDAETKRFTALHELAHIVLRFGEEKTSKEVEALCDSFASEVLLPRSVFIKLIGARRKDIILSELRNLQRLFGISVPALMHKAAYAGVISEKRYRYFCDLMKKEKFKNEVTQSVFVPERSFRFESLVYRALASEVISISRAANLLNSSIEEVRDNYILV